MCTSVVFVHLVESFYVLTTMFCTLSTSSVLLCVACIWLTWTLNSSTNSTSIANRSIIMNINKQFSKIFSFLPHLHFVLAVPTPVLLRPKFQVLLQHAKFPLQATNYV